MQRKPQTPGDGVASRSPQESKPSWLHKRVGKYQIVALIGEGSNGRVFQAEDLQLARQIALKAIRLTAKSGTAVSGIDNAIREARMAAELDHPNIVHVYEVNHSSSVCYIAMELVEGGNLKDLVATSGPLEPLRACQVVADAAEALAHAHQQGVIHRDVKPANLMLSRGGRCKLADFGLAVLRSPTPMGADKTGPAAGTPQFMAPEIIKGEPAGPRSDIYSLAASLWYLLTGKPPFMADNVSDLLLQHLQEPLPKLAKLCPGIPQSLVKVIGKAMEKDPAQRYENAEQFASVLRVHTIPVGATASSLLRTAALDPPPRIRMSLIWGGAAAILGTLLTVGGAWWWFTRANTAPAIRPLAPIRTIPPRQMAARTPVTLPASGIIRATDNELLLALASPGSTTQPTDVIVEGIVSSITATKSGKHYRITFANTEDKRGFCAMYKHEFASELQMKFHGDESLGLSGETVRVSGRVVLDKDRPVIDIESVDQINVVQKN